MKVIDLLNKIANGEEDDLITEFEFDRRVWNFKGLNDSEFCLDGWLLNQNITITKHKEILEEEKKIPMKIYWDITDNTYTTTIGDKDYKGNKNNFEELSDMYRQKINEIIDYLDYLKNKGE